MTGRTTKDMLDAPIGSYYVWPEIRTINYVISLAKSLGREDLKIIPLVSFTDEIVLGNDTMFTLDHACWDIISIRQSVLSTYNFQRCKKGS